MSGIVRHTKWSPDVYRKAKLLFTEGVPCQRICECLGVPATTLYYWFVESVRKGANKWNGAHPIENRNRARDSRKRKYDAIEGRCDLSLKSSVSHAKELGHVACIASIEELKVALVSQDFSCKICGAKDDNTIKTRLCMDHCHETGKFRGWLCRRCNTTCGSLEIVGPNKYVSYLQA